MASELFAATEITDTTTMVFTTEALWYAFGFSILILIFILIPYIIELLSAYHLARKRDEQAKELLDNSITKFISSMESNDSCPTDEQLDKFYEKVLVPIHSTMRQPVAGIAGSTRGIIAYAIIFTVGITVMLVMFATEGDSQIVTNIISMLAATLATIVGFYFGGRTAQDAVKAEKEKEQTVTKSPAVKEKAEPETPVLEVKGINIGPQKDKIFDKSDQDGTIDIFGFWDTYGKKELEYSMDPKTDYSLYCCVESSIAEGQYDIYIEPILKKGFDKIPFLYDLRENYQKMIPHEKQTRWYVKSFNWIPEYKSWRNPGKYQVLLRVGYVKKGKPIGTAPTWIEEDEFTVVLK